MPAFSTVEVTQRFPFTDTKVKVIFKNVKEVSPIITDTYKNAYAATVKAAGLMALKGLITMATLKYQAKYIKQLKDPNLDLNTSTTTSETKVTVPKKNK